MEVNIALSKSFVQVRSESNYAQILKAVVTHDTSFFKKNSLPLSVCETARISRRSFT